MLRIWRFVVPALLLSLLVGCTPPPPATPLPMHWQPIDSLQALLPDGIRVYAGRNDSLPLRAWYVRIDEPDPAITTRVVVSDEEDRRESASSFARDPGVCVVANGGYFTMKRTPAEHVGLLVHDRAVLATPSTTFQRDSLTFEAVRAAIGFREDGTIEMGWAAAQDGAILRWSEPVPNRPDAPAALSATAEPWLVRDALGAGPALLVDGAIRVTDDEEVFFGTSIPKTHPRTAAGRTRDGALILMVVDGRQPESRGVRLDELAVLMRDVGAVDAINLDGGGSSSLVVRGTLLNRPAGDTLQREVMSALVTYCE